MRNAITLEKENKTIKVTSIAAKCTPFVVLGLELPVLRDAQDWIDFYFVSTLTANQRPLSAITAHSRTRRLREHQL